MHRWINESIRRITQNSTSSLYTNTTSAKEKHCRILGKKVCCNVKRKKCWKRIYFQLVASRREKQNTWQHRLALSLDFWNGEPPSICAFQCALGIEVRNVCWAPWRLQWNCWNVSQTEFQSENNDHPLVCFDNGNELWSKCT